MDIVQQFYPVALLLLFQGFVPKALLSSEPIEFPEKVFYYGQVVRCKVVKVDPAERKLRLTFMVRLLIVVFLTAWYGKTNCFAICPLDPC